MTKRSWILLVFSLASLLPVSNIFSQSRDCDCEEETHHYPRYSHLPDYEDSDVEEEEEPADPEAWPSKREDFMDELMR